MSLLLRIPKLILKAGQYIFLNTVELCKTRFVIHSDTLIVQTSFYFKIRQVHVHSIQSSILL